MATLLHADGRMEFDIQPQDGNTFTLVEMQQGVGGYIEVVRLKDGLVMLVNEEGRLRDLPDNMEATRLIRLVYGPAAPAIVGDVLVLDEGQLE